MSSTYLYALRPNGDVTYYGGVKNSFRGAVNIWDYLNDKYDLGVKYFESWEPVWGAYQTGKYLAYEDIVLGSSFDNMLVMKQHIPELISAFKQYYDQVPHSNLDEQIKLLTQMLADDDVKGVGWCQTSVQDDMWDYYWDDDLEELIPYNIHKGNIHKVMFRDIKGGN